MNEMQRFMSFESSNQLPLIYSVPLHPNSMEEKINESSWCNQQDLLLV